MPAARWPALQNWATWPVVPHLEQRRRKASVRTSILLSVVPSSSTNEGGQGEARGDGDGDLDDAVARPGKDFVFAAEDTCDTTKLSKMGSDGGLQQVDGDACEANGGDGVAGSPAVDQGAVAGRPGDAGGGTLALARCRRFHPQKLEDP